MKEIQGLTAKQAQERLQKYGPNDMEEKLARKAHFSARQKYREW